MKNPLSAAEVHKQYNASITAFRRQLTDGALRQKFNQEADTFFRACALGVWHSDGAPVTPRHVEYYNAIYTKGNPVPSVLFWELSTAVSEYPGFRAPAFFARMRACDKVSGSSLARKFVDVLTLLLLLFAAVDNVVSEEEAGFVNQCADALSALCGRDGLDEGKPPLNARDFISQRPDAPQNGEAAPAAAYAVELLPQPIALLERTVRENALEGRLLPICRDLRELGPGEIAVVTPEGIHTLMQPGKEMKICTFLWVYYGYPTSSYEGISVEKMRYNCGALLAERDNVKPDTVAGVPDSGTAHAIGYANKSGIPFSRPFVKYTPTWPRSFMPAMQSQRNLIAKMKLIPVKDLIRGKSLLMIDDSIVRGTQLRETTEFLYHSGAREVHIRPACPPIMFGCKYLNFSRSTSEMDLIARRVLKEMEQEGRKIDLKDYVNPDTAEYGEMVERIGKRLNFTSLRYHRLDDMIASVGIDREKLCTYCWDGIA